MTPSATPNPARSPTHLVARGLGLAGLLALTACYREANDLTLSSAYPRYTGTAPWEIDGVRPGQTLAEIKRLRGEPVQQLDAGPRPTFRWPAPRDTTVTFDSAGRAIDLFGSTLTAEGRTLVDTGLEPAAIEQVLGKGRVDQHAQPTGSGVISFGRRITGRTVAYQNHGSLFEVFTSTDRITAVRAQAKK